MDISKTQQQLEAVEALRGEYQAIQEKRISNYRTMAVLALLVGFAAGAAAGASYWYLYGYPPSTVTVEVLEDGEAQEAPVKEVNTAQF
jgi:hypothetical protein